MQQSRVPILDFAALPSPVIGSVEPYYMFDPDHLHDSARAAWCFDESPLAAVWVNVGE